VVKYDKPGKFIDHVLESFDFYYGGRWCYEDGIFLTSLSLLHKSTGESKYLDFLTKYIDGAVDRQGVIRGYDYKRYSLDDIQAGRALLYLEKQNILTEKVKKAADRLYYQLQGQPRLRSGSYWHKLIYPYQVWLDGLYMGMPFLSEYAGIRNLKNWSDDIIKQFEFCRDHMQEPEGKLYYHGYDELVREIWSQKNQGNSECVWGRAMGWFFMSLVDVMEFLPEGKKKSIQSMIESLASAILDVRDESSKLWKQLLYPDPEGNYIESSCSAMFIYALMKAARMGFVSEALGNAGAESFKAITENYVFQEGEKWGIRDTCVVAGLGCSNPDGGSAYRNGTPEYYISEKISSYEVKGWAPYFMSYSEYLRRPEGKNEEK